jgi:hypothetical protein
VIAGYAVWMLLAGPVRPAGPLHTVADLARFHGDLLGTLLPGSNQVLAPGGLTRLGNGQLAGGVAESGFYLGLPLLVLLGYLAFRCRRITIVAVSVVIGVTAFVLSLGSRLTLNGKVLLSPMPFSVFTRLPVLQNLEAARLSLFVQLAAAIVLGVGLDRVHAEGWRPGAASAPRERAGLARPLAVAVVGLVALVPLLPALPFGSASARVPALFTSQAGKMLPAGAVALTFPFDRVPNTDAMLWQAVSGMRFRIIGGYVIVPGPDGRATWQLNPPGPPVISAVFLAGTKLYPNPPPAAQPQTLAAIRLLCARYRVGVILIRRTAHYAPAVARLIRGALGSPPRVAGQMDVWPDVQRDLPR